MRQYFATLHEKSDLHKKRFAFLASASFTLTIFTVWSLINFGLPNTNRGIAVEGGVKVEENEKNLTLEPVKNGVAAAYKALTGTLSEAKASLEQVNFEGEYEDMRNKAYSTYGR